MSTSYSHNNDSHKRALELLSANELKAALAEFNNCLQIHGANADVIHDRALCHLKMENALLALNDLNEAVILQPSHGYRYSSRAYVKAYLKDFDGAMEDYRKAIELDPEDAISMNNLGLIEEQHGRIDRAKQLFEQADELNKILDENKIIHSNSENLSSESDQVITETIIEPNSNMWSIIGSVFTSSKERKEFLNFIRKGFRR